MLDLVLKLYLRFNAIGAEQSQREEIESYYLLIGLSTHLKRI